MITVAKGSSGGRSGGSSSKSSGSSKSSSSSSKTTAPQKSTPSRSPSANTKVVTDAKKPSAATTKGKPYSSKGNVIDGNYQPRFQGGYTAPAGSVVYYRDHSFIDYLPWIYLFSQDSPRNDQAVIVQPDGKEVAAQPEPEGVDGLLILNWIILLVIALGLIAGVVWGVYKWQEKKR